MPNNKSLKKIGVSFLLLGLLLLPISPLTLSLQSVRATHTEDTGWENYESYTVIDHNTVWSGTLTAVGVEKPVVVVNGAILTIEKGSHIELGSLSVYDGRIIAIGTETEPIVFTKPVFDVSTIPPEFSAYDPKCFTPDGGMIEFADWVDTDQEKPSFFRYVEFNNMGTYLQYDDVDCPFRMTSNDRWNIFNTAHAESQTKYNPALKFQSGRLQIENSRFTNNAYADIETAMQFTEGETPYDFLQIVNSNFENNTQNTALISKFEYSGEGIPPDYSYRVLLKNNWYGSILGPRQAPDYLLAGEKIIGEYKLDGFRGTSLIADPLIVIPGITGSAKVLGTWKLDPITHIYADLMASLKANGYEENINLFPFPYEWRNTNRTSALYLQAKIEGVRQGTRVSKVDVVGHSMGGLVARAYIEEIEGTQYEDTIDQLITLGTPHRGSPEAYLKWEAGEGFFTWKDKLAKHHFEQEAEEAGYNDRLKDYINDRVVSVKELLPDKNYLFDVATSQMRAYSSNYPRNSFLEELNSTTNTQKLNPIRFTNIVGKSDTDNTISQIRVVDSTVAGQWEHSMPENFYDTNTDQGLEYGVGDETVPLASAQGVTSDRIAEIESTHNDLPTKAQCLVFQELTGKSLCAYDEDIHIPNMLLFDVFSPIDIQIISPSGKKVGKNFTNGQIYDQIPGAYYTGYDTQNEFITIPNPEDGEYTILTQGTGDGDYRIEAVKITEGTTPTDDAKESLVTFTGTASPDVTEEKKIELLPDDTVVSKEDQDSLPPTTEISLSGTQGKNGWYTGDVTITLSAQDNENGSGVEKTEYSIDNGATWSIYTDHVMLSQEGTTILQYFSADKQGNREATKTLSVKIDKTAPEAKMVFDPDTERLVITGTDNISQTVSVKTIELRSSPWMGFENSFSWLQNPFQKKLTTTTLLDEAGHKTQITFENRKKSPKYRIDIRLQSLSYDGLKTILPETFVRYQWQRDSKKQYRFFIAYIDTNTESLVSHYSPKYDETLLTKQSKGLNISSSIKQKLPKMIIPGILTEQGRIFGVY